MIERIRRHFREWAKDPNQPLFSARTRWWVVAALLVCYLIIAGITGKSGL